MHDKNPNENPNSQFEKYNHQNTLTTHGEAFSCIIDDESSSRTEVKDNDYSIIRKGEIFVQKNFLTPLQVALLRKDIAQLKLHEPAGTVRKSSPRTTILVSSSPPASSVRTTSAFKPSGLSNREAGDQNIFGSSDRLTCTITADLPRGNKEISKMRQVVEKKMEDLKLELQATLSPKPILSNHHSDTANASTGEDKQMSDRRLPSFLANTCEPLEVGGGASLELELAELYYSISPKGSHLPRHQDERHEETKGSKGWINDARRSISWLIYLNEDGWVGTNTPTDTIPNTDVHENGYNNTRMTTARGRATNQSDQSVGQGGELRAYIKKCCSDQHVQCGSHEGDMQVGWLRIEISPLASRLSTATKAEDFEYEPIFLDSWVKTRVSKSSTPESSKENEEEERCSDYSLEWQAMSALYRIRRVHPSLPIEHTAKASVHNNPRKPLREYLSPPFGPNSPSWPSEQNVRPIDFSRALALQLSSKEHQKRFVGVEDIHPEAGSRDIASHSDDLAVLDIVDIVPTGGTLVLFDSVTVPHEVLEVTQGTRLAIAGWFHEKQQEFPDWYGT